MIKHIYVILLTLFPLASLANPSDLEVLISWGVDNARKSAGWGLVGFREQEIHEVNQAEPNSQPGWGLASFKKTEPVKSINKKPESLNVLEAKNMSDRQQYVMEQALSIGAQGGYHYELQLWNKRIRKHSNWLHKNFHIAPLMLKKGTLLPPVLTTSENNASLSDDARIIRTAGQVFKIIEPPRFVITAPNWETYLLGLPSNSPQKPIPYDLPKTADESLIWEHYIKRGWNEGLKKVEVDYRINIAKLRRDMVGMSLYHILFDRGMISEPIITKNEVPVSGDDNTLIIDDKNLEITVVPKMRQESEYWRPVGQIAELFGKGLIE